MSSDYPLPPPSQDGLYGDMKLSNASPTSQLANSALAYVASSAASLENIEPSLAAMSGHAPIQSAPPNDGSMNHFQGNGGVSTDDLTMGPPSAVKLDHDFMTHGSIAQSSPEVARAKRLNRACDACSKRKVKCDNERPCKNCRDLHIDCTFDRPTKRRGPVNRVAEELKRQKRSSDEDTDLTQTGALEQQPDHQFLSPLSFEAIAPFEFVDRLVTVYFTYIYPLYPFPHENLFLDQFHSLADTNDPVFLALVASMVGMVSITFPRLARMVLFGDVADGNLITFVERCIRVAVDARGTSYLMRDELKINDAATSFFLGMIGARLNRSGQFRLYMAECLSILNLPTNDTTSNVGVPTSLVEAEIGYRIRSAVFVEIKSYEQAGPNYSRLVMSVPPINQETVPTELDDFHIYHERIEDQPEGKLPLVTGLNILTRLYSLCEGVSQLKALATTDPLTLGPIYKDIQNRLISDLETCKQILTSAPPDLSSRLGPEILAEVLLTPEARQQVQLDVQKSAIQISTFATRLYLVVALKELDQLVQAEGIREKIESELQTTASELAFFLKGLGPAIIEPHAPTTIMKLEQILEPMQALQKSGGPGAEEAQYGVERIGELKVELGVPLLGSLS